MSSESAPVLCDTIPAFEEFMTEWEDIKDDTPRLKKYIEPRLECVYKYYVRMDDTQAYIITMRMCLLCPPAPIIS